MEDEPDNMARLRGYVIGCDCDIVARLRGAAISSCDCVKCEAADEIERLRAERDEARRELCAARRELCRNEATIRLQRHRVHRNSEDVVGLAKEIAVERGWDCFKEKP